MDDNATPETDPEEIFSTVEAAKFLGVSGRTLQDWRTAERHCGPSYHYVGSLVKYRRKDLERFRREVQR